MCMNDVFVLYSYDGDISDDSDEVTHVITTDKDYPLVGILDIHVLCGDRCIIDFFFMHICRMKVFQRVFQY